MRAILIGAALAAAACAEGDPVLTVAPSVAMASMQARGLDGALLDAQTRLRIGAALLGESEALFMAVSAEVMEGRVLLAGAVPRAEDRIAAERLAWSVPTVRAVANEIRVAAAPPLAERLADLRITAEIRARLLAAREVRALNYNIETSGRTVHLLGLARDRGELHHAAAIAAGVAGVARVVSHVYLLDDPARRVPARPGPG